jgi:hypothetical protein
MAPNICGSSLWNFHHVTFLVPRILKWRLEFWNIFAPLIITLNLLNNNNNNNNNMLAKKKKKVKQSLYRPGQALRVPGV